MWTSLKGELSFDMVLILGEGKGNGGGGREFHKRRPSFRMPAMRQGKSSFWPEFPGIVISWTILDVWRVHFYRPCCHLRCWPLMIGMMLAVNKVVYYQLWRHVSAHQWLPVHSLLRLRFQECWVCGGVPMMVLFVLVNSSRKKLLILGCLGKRSSSHQSSEWS